jgi:hypothetical protein
VVLTYDRSTGGIYVNGVFTGDIDPLPGGSLTDWDNSFAFVLGNEVSSDRQWRATAHGGHTQPRAKRDTDQQNFSVGVGEIFRCSMSMPPA